MRSFRLPVLTVLLSLVLFCGAAAQPKGGHEAKPESGLLTLLPAPVDSEHSIALPGGTLSYKAEAGTLDLLGGDGEVTASIFYVAYDAKPANAEQPRPITFVFNGGPGAASAYLHLGGLGPRVLTTTDTGEFLEPPQHLMDNPDTWLDMTDLVFVDPVGTGYSRAAKGEKPERFWSVQNDATSMGAFIRLYLQKTGRTDDRVFLVGESYGGFRAALLAKTLQEDVGISPSGVVLISPALEFSLIHPDEFAPLHFALTLPSMAAVDLERQGIVGAEMKKRLTEVEDYARTDYLVALASGLEAGGKAASSAVSRYTGLPIELVERHFARIPVNVFAKEFARKSGRILSLYDGTVDTADLAPQSSRPLTPDPVLDRSVPVVTSAFVDYVRNELNYRTPVSYRLLNRETSRKWDYDISGQGYAGVLDDLQEARALNPHLEVLIAQGYTDLVTPYAAALYLIGQLPTLPQTSPIHMRVYEGGHMMYLRPDSRRALKQDAAELYGEGPEESR